MAKPNFFKFVILIVTALIVVGVGLLIANRRDLGASSLSSVSGNSIPVVTDPGDSDIRGSNESGGLLQQPDSLAGQAGGASDLQGAAQIKPEDLNSINF